MAAPGGTGRSANVEARLAARLGVLDVNPVDICVAGAFATPVAHGFDRIGLALENGFDGAVRPIPHPARHARPNRGIAAAVAKEHALHAAVDDHMSTDHPYHDSETHRDSYDSTVRAWITSPTIAPTRVPLIRMNWRSRPTCSSIRSAASLPSHRSMVCEITAAISVR